MDISDKIKPVNETSEATVIQSGRVRRHQCLLMAETAFLQRGRKGFSETYGRTRPHCHTGHMGAHTCPCHALLTTYNFQYIHYTCNLKSFVFGLTVIYCFVWVFQSSCVYLHHFSSFADKKYFHISKRWFVCLVQKERKDFCWNKTGIKFIFWIII